MAKRTKISRVAKLERRVAALESSIRSLLEEYETHELTPAVGDVVNTCSEDDEEIVFETAPTQLRKLGFKRNTPTR